jgi:ABC-type transporter Mla MlaB component
MTAHVDGLNTAETMTIGRGSGRLENAAGRLEVQLYSGPDRCVVQFFGDLVDQTRMVVREIGEIVRNDARVVLDLSGVTSFDNLGLEAALELVDTVRSSGGRVTIGGETCDRPDRFVREATL